MEMKKNEKESKIFIDYESFFLKLDWWCENDVFYEVFGQKRRKTLYIARARRVNAPFARVSMAQTLANRPCPRLLPFGPRKRV